MLEERKLVTVLFADVIGSTALSEGLDPERLRVVLDAYFEAMAETIARWGGTVEKFIGDAVVAVFGVPSVREDDADRALKAALDMLAGLGDLNRGLEQTHQISLQIRIGVNTGEVLAATQRGLDQRLVAGDAVNLAARLQAAAEPGSVLVGERTWLATRRSFLFADPIVLGVKGKTEPIRARRLESALAEGRRGIEGLWAPMVGREAELQLLVNVLEDAVASRSPRLVTVMGKAGVGKSRLIGEFGSLARKRMPDAHLLRGRCLSSGQGITYWALDEILRSACDISLDDPAAVFRQKLEDVVGLALQVSGLSDPEVEHTIFALAMTAGVALPGSSLSGLEPETVADELSQAWPRMMTALASRGTVIVVIEDLHWADDALVRMLERVVARSSGPLLVVGTARPEFSEKYSQFGGGSEDFSTITLRALSPRQTQELIDGLLRVADLPGDVRAAILSRAEGNPLFVEEIIQRLIEVGALTRAGERWVATESAAQVTVPDTLQALLASRIDSLTAREKRVLQEAAIVGMVFWEQPLGRITGLPEVRLALLELERRGIVFGHVRSSLAGQAEFSFKHVLLRDVYASVPKARRARAHAETADWLAALAGDRKEEFAELLAYHYEAAASGDGADLAWKDAAERAAIRRTAFDHLIAAGQGARQRFAVSKAVELHERAFALASDDAERAQAREQVGDDHDSAYHGEAAVAAFEQALGLMPESAESALDRSRLYWKMVWLMALRPGAFKLIPDGNVVDDLVAAGMSAAPDELSRGRLLVARGLIARLWGGSKPFGQASARDPVPIEQRIRWAEEGHLIGRRLQNRDLIRRATQALGLLYEDAGRYSDALTLARSWLEEMDATQVSRIEQAEAIRNVAELEMMVAGHFDAGLELARRSHELSQGSNPHQIMHATYTVLVGLHELGRWQELTPFLEEHLAAFQKDPAVGCESVRDGPVIGATTLTLRGNIEGGRELATLVGHPGTDLTSASAWQARYANAAGDAKTGWDIAQAKALEHRSFGPEFAHPAVEALVALRRWQELRDFLPKIQPHIAGNALLGPVCDRAEGLMALAGGDWRTATAALRRALHGFQALGAIFETARTGEQLAELLDAREARSLREAALEVFERLGALPHMERLRAALIETPPG